MKMMKKALAAMTLSSVLAVTAVIPSIVPVTRVEAAPSPVKLYDFNGDSGMSPSGIAGSTAPTVVDDAERGSKVLQFADGASSKLVQQAQDSSLGAYDYRVDMGSPSSLSFPNPFSGKSVSGITIAYWLKVPSQEALTKGSGIVGFISDRKTVPHPDKATDSTGKEGLEDGHGEYSYGLSCAFADPVAMEQIPMVYFCALHHNTYNYNEVGGALVQHVGKWVFVTVTQTNSSATVYINGQKIEGDEYKNKRWNDGEANGGTTGNTGQVKFTEFIGDSSVKAYVGFTGYSPTVSGVCIDDLMFFDSALSGADVSSLYSSAQSGGVTPGASNSSGGNSSGSSSADKEAAAKAAAQKAAEEAARKEAEAQAANKAMTDSIVSSVTVAGMKNATPNVSGIFRGNSSYTALVAKLNGVTLRSGYRVADVVGLDISFGGAQPSGVATISMNVPSGFNASSMEVVRINDDGTVSKLDYTVENGVIKAKTNHFSTYAIVSLEAGSGSSSNLPNTGAAATGTVAAVGAAAILCGVILLKKKKEIEA